MSDFSKFIQEGAKFMVADRPDVFDTDSATEALSRWFSELSAHDMDNDNRPVSFGSGGFELTRLVPEEGENEYVLNRHILSFTTYAGEGESYLFNWTKRGALTDILLDVED